MERKWFLRAQIVRELALGARQRIGLEPWGRMRVEYQGLTPELTCVLKWADRLGCKAIELIDGIASLLDNCQSSQDSSMTM